MLLLVLSYKLSLSAAFGLQQAGKCLLQALPIYCELSLRSESLVA